MRIPECRTCGRKLIAGAMVCACLFVEPLEGVEANAGLGPARREASGPHAHEHFPLARIDLVKPSGSGSSRVALAGTIRGGPGRAFGSLSPMGMFSGICRGGPGRVMGSLGFATVPSSQSTQPA